MDLSACCLTLHAFDSKTHYVQYGSSKTGGNVHFCEEISTLLYVHYSVSLDIQGQKHI